MIIERRSFLKGLSALFVAPAIIKAENLMPIREYAPSVPDWCPDGWLPLDGREIKKKFYPDLYAARERLRYPLRLSMQNLEGSSTATVISARDMVRPNGTIMRAGVGYEIILPRMVA
jgi:hypothetical protein